MEKELEKLYLNQMTQQRLYKIFGLREVDILPEFLKLSQNTIDNSMCKKTQLP